VGRGSDIFFRKIYDICLRKEEEEEEEEETLNQGIVIRRFGVSVVARYEHEHGQVDTMQLDRGLWATGRACSPATRSIFAGEKEWSSGY